MTTHFQHDHPDRTGILLVNLGTPDEPTAKALRRYLREFLSDRRVVEVPRVFWLPLLYGVIVPLRSPRSAHAYSKIWLEDGSPLRVYSQQLAQNLARFWQQSGEEFSVELAMRYGQPDIGSALQRLKQQQVRRLLVVPLYPQYSATTTASVFDAVVDSLKLQRWLPELRFINEYHQHPGWQNAVAAKISDYWSRKGRAQKLLFSFHGLPKRNLLLGDPYFCQCQASARNIADLLELSRDEYTVTFQSRFGKAEWLQPYTEPVLHQLAADGVKTVDVVCPGFAVDCLETLEEIALQYAESYRSAGGQALNYIPALNADTGHVEFFAKLIEQHCQGWPEQATPAGGGLSERQERAANEAQSRGWRLPQSP